MTNHDGEMGKLLAFDPERRRRRTDVATTAPDQDSITIARSYARGSTGAVRAPRIESLPAIETSQVEPMPDAVAAPYLQPALDPAERTTRPTGRLWVAIFSVIVAMSALVWLTISL